MYDDLLEKHRESDDKQSRIRDSFQHKIEALQGSLSREVNAGEGARTAVVRLNLSLNFQVLARMCSLHDGGGCI